MKKKTFKFQLVQEEKSYRLEVDVKRVLGRIRLEAFNGADELGIPVEEVRPRDGHGSSELAGADVKEPPGPAGIRLHGHGAETLVGRILSRRVERVVRRTETVGY